MKKLIFDDTRLRTLELFHYNPYHDPKTGQFTSAGKGELVPVENYPLITVNRNELIKTYPVSGLFKNFDGNPYNDTTIDAKYTTKDSASNQNDNKANYSTSEKSTANDDADEDVIDESVEVSRKGISGAAIDELLNNMSKFKVKGKRSEGHKKYAKFDKLTDQELQARINRLRLEQTYSDLTGKTRMKRSAKDLLSDTTNDIATLAAFGASVLIPFIRAIRKKNN